MIITIAQLRHTNLTVNGKLTSEFKSLLVSAIKQFFDTPEAQYGHRYEGSAGEPVEVCDDKLLIRIRETGSRRGHCSRCDEYCDYCS